jgi:hypothetical protein
MMSRAEEVREERKKRKEASSSIENKE